MKRNFGFLFLILSIVAFCTLNAKKTGKEFNVVYIGNSITFGAMHEKREATAPPVIASALLSKKKKREVLWRNCGCSGATTYDFLPSHERYFTKVKSAVEELQKISPSPILFSIMLGTNDSACTGTMGCPVSNEDYRKNLITIMDSLKSIAPNAIFVLHRPIWYSPNTYNFSMYLKVGLERLTAYINPINELAEERTDVYVGDIDAYDYFRENHLKKCFHEDGNAGIFYLHPNEKGAAKLAAFWANAILRVMR